MPFTPLVVTAAKERGIFSTGGLTLEDFSLTSEAALVTCNKRSQRDRTNQDGFTNLGSVTVDILFGRWDTVAFLGSEGGRSLENLSSSKTVRTGGFRRGVRRSPVQRGELVKRGDPLDLFGMLLFTIGVKPVLLTEFPSFRRLRTA